MIRQNLFIKNLGATVRTICPGKQKSKPFIFRPFAAQALKDSGFWISYGFMFLGSLISLSDSGKSLPRKTKTKITAFCPTLAVGQAVFGFMLLGSLIPLSSYFGEKSLFRKTKIKNFHFPSLWAQAFEDLGF